MAVTQRISGQEYERIALGNPDGQWELHRGELREKPGMSAGHNWEMVKLGHLLQLQLDWNEYQVRVNAGRVRRTSENYSIPDVFVLPIEPVRPLRDRFDVLEAYDTPLPLVVEVWSPSTGRRDGESKLPEYQARGDLEIWRLHPFERMLPAWTKQPDGSYAETVYREGVVWPAYLPNVAIDLGVLLGR